MTKDNLVTAPVGTTLEQAKVILQKYKIEKLPIVDDEFNLRGLITIKDIEKSRQYPSSAKDKRGPPVSSCCSGRQLRHHAKGGGPGKSKRRCYSRGYSSRPFQGSPGDRFQNKGNVSGSFRHCRQRRHGRRDPGPHCSRS